MSGKKQTVAQKILANKVGKESVEVGEIVVVRPDRVLSHDNSEAIIRAFKKTGAKKIIDTELPVIILIIPSRHLKLYMPTIS
jgi:3-isopropylmalate/(R)-2-methylmalate dehydratase large subunit